MVNMKCFPDEHFVSHMGNIKENKKVQMVNTKCLPDEHCVSHMEITETWETYGELVVDIMNANFGKYNRENKDADFDSNLVVEGVILEIQLLSSLLKNF